MEKVLIGLVQDTLVVDETTLMKFKEEYNISDEHRALVIYSVMHSLNTTWYELTDFIDAFNYQEVSSSEDYIAAFTANKNPII